MPLFIFTANMTINLIHRLIPETKGRSLEEMDIIFGAVSAAEREAKIQQAERGIKYHIFLCLDYRALIQINPPYFSY